jgi:hypothetical protein
MQMDRIVLSVRSTIAVQPKVNIEHTGQGNRAAAASLKRKGEDTMIHFNDVSHLGLLNNFVHES